MIVPIYGLAPVAFLLSYIPYSLHGSTNERADDPDQGSDAGSGEALHRTAVRGRRADRGAGAGARVCRRRLEGGGGGVDAQGRGLERGVGVVARGGRVDRANKALLARAEWAGNAK